MDISRRVLLKVGALCAAGAMFPAARGANLLAAIPRANLRQFSLPMFSPRRNEIFQLSHQGRTTALKLIEVKDLLAGQDVAPNGGECFSLLFRGYSNTRLKQGTYRLRHPDLGTLVMFLVPVNQPMPDGDGHYEAIINRRTRRG